MGGSSARSGRSWPRLTRWPRTLSALATLPLCGAARALGLLLAATLAMSDSSVAGATSPTCRSEPLGPDGAVLVNCSAASTAAILSVLEGTDAAKLGLIGVQDRFLANSQWLAWIDATQSPGTLHGLWALTPSGAFAGITDPTVGDGYKSLIAIGAGFGGPNANPKRGYRGTHVEVWHSPDSWYYTYPSGPPASSDVPPVEPHQSVSRYSTPLVDNRDGNGTVVGVNGVQAHMSWTISYTIEPDRFVVETELEASDDVDLAGDVGGLLLLTNPACSVPGNFGDCPDAGAALSSRSLHRLVAPVADDLLFNRQIAAHTDQVFATRDGPATWELVSDAAAHSLITSPRWSVTDPQGQPFIPKTAYHYNSRASDVGGLNGFGSLDLVLEPPPGGSIALGPTRGTLRFGQVLTHRGALSTKWAETAAVAEGALRTWADVGRGLFFWGYSARDLRVSIPLPNVGLVVRLPGH